MDKKKLQQAFIQYLAQKYQLKSQQELQAKAQELGEEGMKKEYAEFIQYMQQQGVQVARLGAKLNYLRQLRGKCPEGYEVAYYKQGGKTCAVCQKVGTQQQGGNVVEDFKKKRKVTKAMEGTQASRPTNRTQSMTRPTPGGQYSNQTFNENGRPARYESYQDRNDNWFTLRTQGNDSTFYFNGGEGNPNGPTPNFEGSKTNGKLNVPQSSWDAAVNVWNMIKKFVNNGQVEK